MTSETLEAPETLIDNGMAGTAVAPVAVDVSAALAVPHTTGRPTSEVRDECKAGFADNIAVLRQIAAGDIEADPGERIKAIDTLGKYGVGVVKEISVDAVREKVGATLEIIRAQCPPDLAAALINALRPVWL